MLATNYETATAKQITYLSDLINKKLEGDTLTASIEWLDRNKDKMTRRYASEKIEGLRKMPNVRKAYTAVEAIEDGIYKVENTIYKVQTAVHGSGRKYAKKLVIEDGEAWFEMAPGAIRRIKEEHKLSLEEAAKFGQVYGWCIKCGRTLTDENSIAAGIGPICASKF